MRFESKLHKKPKNIVYGNDKICKVQFSVFNLCIQSKMLSKIMSVINSSSHVSHNGRKRGG